MSRDTTLSDLARLGFAELGTAGERIAEFDLAPHLAHFAAAADPDQAVRALGRLREQAPDQLATLLADEDAAARLIQVLGASQGLADFLLRRPAELIALASPLGTPLTPERYRADLVDAVAGLDGDAAVVALRVRYRHHLVRLTAWDLASSDPLAAVSTVSAALADLAGAALEAALAVARTTTRFSAERVAGVELSIIGMGKAGARELNYVSDVDVIFVGEGDLDVATQLAMQVMRAIHEPGIEPPLWEVDANLRPEGKDGALVRTLESHVAYYERWASLWEFQALLKARPLAGDVALGERYVEAIAPFVWSSSGRDGFVESVQRMRERVTEHIPHDQVDVQLKLGPGGLRDVEFTIQLLQLVHGRTDENVRQGGTLLALLALADQGYIGRAESTEFARDYRFLRLLEHRLQLRQLRRTHLMPRDEEELRVLARASGVASSAGEITERWQQTKSQVRTLHERLFYRPLLSAVAAIGDGFSLSSEQAVARLAAIGFLDPEGALRHIAALTAGVSRRAAIQRTLLPVMLRWFAEGADPDHGLLAFRRLSDDLGEAYWFLRMLRDSSAAAERLTSVLSGSKYVSDLFERIPEAAAWLENDDELRPRSGRSLVEEARATVARHDGDPEAAASALKTARRREILRLALGGILGVTTIKELGQGLSDVTSAILTGVLAMSHGYGDGIEFAVIAMGRYGGEELGFGSDADVMYVYKPAGASDEDAQKTAEAIVKSLKRHTEDLRLPLDLDSNLRPEGRNGVAVRSLESYRAYYARWSLTWEAQALLRARGAVGDAGVIADFERLADEVRYPERIDDSAVREVKRIKARVESERLPQGADPKRHLKLGRGSLSDVEWYVQLLQLQHGARVPGLRTTSTLDALHAAREEGLVSAEDAERLEAAWVFASRTRSSLTLFTSKTTDVLPSERRQLDGVARIMNYPPGSASQLEDDYLRTTRLARQVFEKGFYGS